MPKRYVVLALAGSAFLNIGYAMGREPVQPEPIGNPGDWVTSSDYPTSELSRGINGTTAFTLMIGKSGSVEDCAITQSSGSDVLDATACALLKARGKFRPGRDAKGSKISSLWNSRVVWRIPSDQALSLTDSNGQKSGWTISVNVDEKGVVEKCELSTTKTDFVPPPNALTPCSRFPAGYKMRAFENGEGKPIKVRITMTQTTEVTAR